MINSTINSNATIVCTGNLCHQEVREKREVTMDQWIYTYRRFYTYDLFDSLDYQT